jgi:hypothetical protein
MFSLLKNYLIIIHANNPEPLIKFRTKANYWLPEFSSKPSNNIYSPPNIICTTKSTTIELIKVLIQEKRLPYDKVIWINGNNPKITICYTFNQAGNFNNFFRI